MRRAQAFIYLQVFSHSRNRRCTLALSEGQRSSMKRLTEMGIVEHIGRDKYVLARSLYSAVGKPGVHTRIVGLDRETNKELLLKHLKKKGAEGAPFRELQQVFPG